MHFVFPACYMFQPPQTSCGIWVILHEPSQKKNTFPTRLPQVWIPFCEIEIILKISIHDKSYCFMATSILRADIQKLSQNSFCRHKLPSRMWHNFFPLKTQSSFYAHFKVNKLCFPITCYTNTYITFF
jgi:hypothetical protein